MVVLVVLDGGVLDLDPEPGEQLVEVVAVLLLLGLAEHDQPAAGGDERLDRVELLGTEGTMIIDDDHLDHILYSERGVPHAYVPDHQVNLAFLGSNTAGDWAVGDFWGPLANETRAWLDHLVTGNPTAHTTPEQALINLETTIAIERSARSGQAVRLPLES